MALGDRLFLAQGGSRLSASARPFAAPGQGRRLGRARSLGTLGQFGLGTGAGLVRLPPAAVKQHALGAPQLRPDLAVARGLSRLARKLGQLLGQLFDHIVNPSQVLFGPVELQLRLVTALVKARDPGRFLKDPAAVARAGTISSAICPCRTSAGECDPVEASANSIRYRGRGRPWYWPCRPIRHRG